MLPLYFQLRCSQLLALSITAKTPARPWRFHFDCVIAGAHTGVVLHEVATMAHRLPKVDIAEPSVDGEPAAVALDQQQERPSEHVHQNDGSPGAAENYAQRHGCFTRSCR